MTLASQDLNDSLYLGDHSDVYFRHDPALHLADLDEFDLQIPGSWSTANSRAVSLSHSQVL